MNKIRMEFCIAGTMMRPVPGDPSGILSRKFYCFVLKRQEDDEHGLIVPATEFHLDCFNAKAQKKELPWKLSYHFFEEADEDSADIKFQEIVIDRLEHVDEADVDVYSARIEYEKDGTLRSRRIMPAEGIVIATYAGAGIFVEEGFFEAHKIIVPIGGPGDTPLLPSGGDDDGPGPEPGQEAEDAAIEEMRKKLDAPPHAEDSDKNQ